MGPRAWDSEEPRVTWSSCHIQRRRKKREQRHLSASPREPPGFAFQAVCGTAAVSLCSRKTSHLRGGCGSGASQFRSPLATSVRKEKNLYFCRANRDLRGGKKRRTTLRRRKKLGAMNMYTILDYGDSFTDIYICLKLPNCILYILTVYFMSIFPQ